MKKLLLIILMFFSVVGCSNPKEKNIPEKVNADGFAIVDSGVTTFNLDEYLFREDVMYVDLRYTSNIISNGHVAGFQFYSFYEFIAHYTNKQTLYKMNGTGGLSGSFTPNYIESEQIITSIFPKNKIIFAISESGDVSTYFFRLLHQLGYDPSLLYNIGGYDNNAGFQIAYRNLENAKYKVNGNGIVSGVQVYYSYDKIINSLTPIE